MAGALKMPSPFSEKQQPDVILARSLYRDLVRGGRTRTDILGFVNLLLGMVVESGEGRLAQPPVDPATGFATRSGFHLLVMHELDASVAHGRKSGVLVLQVAAGVVELEAARRLRDFLRATDVVSPLGARRVGVVIYPREASHVELVVARIEAALKTCQLPITAMASAPLNPGSSPRAVWSRLLRSLRQGVNRKRS